MLAGRGDELDPGWPPVLVLVGLVLLTSSVLGVVIMFRHARAAARAGRRLEE